MAVTVFGIVTLVKAEQSEKTYLSMFVTPFGIVTLVKAEQPENAR